MNLFSNQEHRYIFSEHFIDRKQAVISDEWKLIVNNDTGSERTRELYARNTDPNETTNVAVKYPEVMERLEKALQEHIAKKRDFRQTKTFQFPEWINEEERKKLIETGYF